MRKITPRVLENSIASWHFQPQFKSKVEETTPQFEIPNTTPEK